MPHNVVVFAHLSRRLAWAKYCHRGVNFQLTLWNRSLDLMKLGMNKALLVPYKCRCCFSARFWQILQKNCRDCNFSFRLFFFPSGGCRSQPGRGGVSRPEVPIGGGYGIGLPSQLCSVGAPDIRILANCVFFIFTTNYWICRYYMYMGQLPKYI